MKGTMAGKVERSGLGSSKKSGLESQKDPGMVKWEKSELESSDYWTAYKDQGWEDGRN